MNTYIVAQLKYISKKHADNEDHDDEEDETDMTSHIQKICFATTSIKKLIELLEQYPFDDDIEFNITEEKLTKRFNQVRKYRKPDDMDAIFEEIGIYYEDDIAQYFIVAIEVPTLL